MKSGKQRRAELDAKRAAKRASLDLETKKAEMRIRVAALGRGLIVDQSALSPNCSMSEPAFVERGYYIDEPFECEECGEPQIWRATQQKWWYEVAKGDRWTKASRCRPCRQRKRTQRNEARRIQQEGLAKKAHRAK